MASPTKSFLGSFTGKLGRKKSTRSTNSDANPAPAIAAAPLLGAVPAPTISRTGRSRAVADPLPDNSQAPPPSYSEAISTNPVITVRAPTMNTRGASPSPSAASHISVASLSTPDDPFAFLSTFDTVFLIDDSGSMAGRSWREVKEALRAITPICTSHDADGIDVYFLNARNPATNGLGGSSNPGGWKNIRSPDQVEQLFKQVRPTGGTPTGTRINQIMKPYLREYEEAVRASGGDADDCGVKPVNMIVITDGVPTDDPESVIVQIARRLDRMDAPPYQVGIQFFQVGNERGAAEALQELDDSLGDLAGGLRDIVDTVTWNAREGRETVLTANGILKVVLGAVVRRLDRRRNSGESMRPRAGRLVP